MAFPSSPPLQKRLESLLQDVGHLKSLAANRISTMAAGSVSADYLVDIYRFLLEVDARLGAVAATSGLPAYAQQQFDNEGIDLAAEFTALRGAVQAAGAHIKTALPKDANGFLLLHTWSGNSIVPRAFNQAATATLRTLLQSIVDAIE